MPLPPAHFSARQRELLGRFRTDELAASQRILPKEEREAPALSFSQQRLWFLDRLIPNSSLYNVPIAARLEGSLNVPALKESLTEIVRRHKILRTRYVSPVCIGDGMPVPTADEAAPFELKFSDLASDPAARRETVIEDRINHEANLPFDLQQGPILRASLYRLERDVHILVLVIHHIAFDVQSVSLLLRELNTLYSAFCEGRRSPLRELPIQYEDFAVWQRKWLQGNALEAQLGYWVKRLAGAPATLAITADYTVDAPISHRGESLPFALSGPLMRQIAQLSQSENASMFMTLLTSFQLLLHRYSGQSTMVVGTPIANRNHREIEELIGFFGNMLPLRSDLVPGMNFRQLLRQVRATTLDSYANQDLPFERLVQELHLDRSLGQPPVFQAMFSLQNMRHETLAMRGLRVKLMEIESPWVKFTLHLALTEHVSGMTGSLRYSSDLFSKETISGMLESWQCLLQEIVRDPDARASLLPLLSESKRQKLLVGWNQTQTSFPRVGPRADWIHELFERQTEAAPHDPALITENETLSYDELNARSNRLAHYLRALNVRPEFRVGVYMERSAEMVVALLAILKAGGAYVPLDPGYPAERLEYMMADAALQVVLTRQRFESALKAHKVMTISVDSVWERISHFPSGNLATDLAGDNLAYIIYTSGSTGQPKGAMNTHHGVRNRLLWMQEYIPLTSKDRVLQKTPFSFDVSVWEFFWPLLAGAGLVMARPGGHQDSKYLKDVIAEQGITVLHFVPPMLEVFIEEEDLEQLGCVKHVVCSGEALSWELKERFLARMSAKLHNLYGPTEAAVDVTHWECERGGKSRRTPIGRPIANLQMYVLDEELQPVPPGVIGELYIGGVGVGRGYWNQPQLTAARFIPHPFRRGERLYRTGDLGRWLSTGVIEYVGRIDHQIKLRGIRIELEEIEVAMRKHPQVRDAVVLAREDHPGKKQLVAYVMTASGDAPSHTDLKAFVKQKLPEYMAPAVFIFLDRFPLLENGKVDRKVLPAPSQSAPSAQLLDPRDALEVELLNIWREVLGVIDVGIDQNFFALGGHSLSAIQLVSRIKKRFQEEIPVSTLFQFSTVAEIALLLRRNTERQPARALVPIQPAGANPKFFCVHAIGGHVLSYVGLARSLGTEQPFYGLQALGLDGRGAPLTNVPDMAAHYLNEIRSAQAVGPYYLGGWSLGGLIAYEMAQQLYRQREEVGLLALIDSGLPSGGEASDGEASKQGGDAHPDQLIRALLPNLMIEISKEKLSGLTEERQLLVVLESGKRTQQLPSDFSLEQAQNLLSVFRANLKARNSYTPQPYPGKIVFFRASEPMKNKSTRLDSAWEKLALSGLEVHDISGNHYTMLSRPDNVRLLSTILKRSIETSQRRKPGSMTTMAVESTPVTSHT